MRTYKSMTDSVITYLTENQYCSTLIRANERCFQKFEVYLNQNAIDYSPDVAENWLAQTTDLSQSDREPGRMALCRLKDVYETGQIRLEHQTRHLLSYTTLSGELLSRLHDFLLELKQTYTEVTVDDYKHSCAKFLAFAQRSGINMISGVTPALIADFYENAFYYGTFTKPQVNSHVAAMMRYFYEKGYIPYSCTVIIHYLSHGKNTGCYWNDISRPAHETISRLNRSESSVGTDALLKYKETLVNLHRQNGYSKSVVTVNNRTADLLILFLEMNGYCYNPEIAFLWFDEILPYLGTQAPAFRRALCMIADCHHSSRIVLETIYREKPSAFSLIPEWCRDAANRYVESKINEGWELSTLDMIRSSITRFCKYLDMIGIRSFQDVNASHIKQFNANDVHKTPQGKNAYNGRIRKFLTYLGEYGYLSNPMLFVSLSRTSAPKETIVVILTEDEMAELSKQLDDDNSRLTLRKKAMLLLGLKMGLRASDVVNLRIEDVNWDEASIRFVQKKTTVEVNLPMPIEVANALFRYIMEERGRKEAKSIFLSDKAPRKPVGRATCQRALETALPDRKVEGSGFHVTRKTYATNLLRNGVGVGMVAEALGQRGTSSLHRYLSLDVERMQMCPLSLSECGIGGWTHG